MNMDKYRNTYERLIVDTFVTLIIGEKKHAPHVICQPCRTYYKIIKSTCVLTLLLIGSEHACFYADQRLSIEKIDSL